MVTGHMWVQLPPGAPIFMRFNVKTNEIAAYFFYIWDTDQDQNRELNREEVSWYLDTANKFMGGVSDLLMNLSFLREDSEEEIQYYLYEVGKKWFGIKKELLLWFKCLYSIFFGYSDGPRIGTFIHIFGIEPFLNKLEIRVNNPFELKGI